MADAWKGAKVAVTGAGGFIGSHLTEALARRGARVRALVRYNSKGTKGFLERLPADLKPRVEVAAGDVTDASFVARFVEGQEAVFHLAALIAIPYSYQAPRSFVAANVEGTLNVLEACLRAKVRRLVHTSTSEVYGTALYTPIDEKHPLQGQSPYSASKIGADQLAESFHRSFGLPVATVRPFNTFGPRQSARAVLPSLVCQALSGRAKIQAGSLAPLRDFNFVADTVEGFLAAGSSPKAVGEVVNIGSGRCVSIGDAAKMILRITASRGRLERDPRRVRPAKSEVGRLLCDNRKARRLLGWRPRVSLEDGLRRLVEYVKAHPDEYRPEEYAV